MAALTAAERHRIARLYLNDHLTTREIAAIIGCLHTTVRQALIAAEIPLRPRGGRPRQRPHVPPDPDIQIHPLQPAEVAAMLNALTRDLSTTALLWWLRPRPGTQGEITRTFLRDLSCRSDEVTTRIACRHGHILAAAWWTTCTTPTHPDIDLTIPGRDHHQPRRALLYQHLASRHPAKPHDHLLALVTTSTHRRRGIGSALITDPGLTGPDRPRYLLLPGTSTTLATRIGCQKTATPLVVTKTLTLHPCWLPGAPPPATNPPNTQCSP